MKYTLLDLVQTTASSLSSDEVNSINDSVESLQIAAIAKTVYFDIINRSNLPSLSSIVTLDPSGDSSKPVLMYIPDTVEKIEWVKYNAIATLGDPLNMEMIKYLSVEDFFDRMYHLNEDQDNVATFSHTVGTDTFKILYENDRQPQYYTTFDNNTLVFDSFDASIESTLQKSNTACGGKLIIPFSMTDTFVPNLDDEQFPLMLNEMKSLAWLELKQAPHQIAERNSKRNWSLVQKHKYATERLSDFDQLPNFGRK